MNLKSLDGIAAEFAKRNARKALGKTGAVVHAQLETAGIVPAIPPRPREKCIGCRRQFRRTEPSCWSDRKGPYCFECWEQS